jgi:hypothetical protein
MDNSKSCYAQLITSSVNEVVSAESGTSIEDSIYVLTDDEYSFKKGRFMLIFLF